MTLYRRFFHRNKKQPIWIEFQIPERQRVYMVWYVKGFGTIKICKN